MGIFVSAGLVSEIC